MFRVYKKQIFVCTKENFDGCCARKGAVDVLKQFRRVLSEKKLLQDVLVTETGCTGQHTIGPTVIVHPDGVWYARVKPDDVEEIVEKHIQSQEVVTRLLNEQIKVEGS